MARQLRCGTYVKGSLCRESETKQIPRSSNTVTWLVVLGGDRSSVETQGDYQLKIWILYMTRSRWTLTKNQILGGGVVSKCVTARTDGG